MPSNTDILGMRSHAEDYWQEAADRWNDLLDAYHGNYQKMWPGEFRRGESPKVVNWLKLGVDRYKTMISKVPTHHVLPEGLRRSDKKDADEIEKVLSHYDWSSNMQTLIKHYGFYLSLFGAAVVGVLPDGILKGPKYFVKDPRNVFIAPGADSLATSTSGRGVLTKPMMEAQSIQWAIVDESVTASYVQASFPDFPASNLNGHRLTSPQEMLTYIDTDMLKILINGETALTVEHDMGFVPIRQTTMFVPDQLGGQSMFEQNIGLILAYMRILNQKLGYNQNVVWPWLVTRGLANINSKERIIELMDRDGQASFLSPPGELQIERDLDTLDRLIRVMNHDTEAMQGEAPGSIVTGRSIIELNRDIRSVVSDFWEVMKPDLEFVKRAGLIIDEEFYGGVEKPMMGRWRGESFQTTYIPREVIQGRYNVEVDFGIGVGGFEGFVELMQFAAQGYIDEQQVMEHAPWIRSVSETRRAVFLDRTEKLMLEMVAGSAPPHLINHMSAWHEAVSKGQDPWKWISKNQFPEPMAPEGLGLPPGAPPPPGAGAPPAGPMGAPANIPAPSPNDILASMMGQGGR